jgi:hypothetical protein
VRAKFTLLPYNLYHKPSLVFCRCSVCRCLLVAHMHAYARKACFVRSYPTRSCISMPDPYLQGVRGTASTHLTARRPHILVVCCRSYHQQTPHYRSCAYERSVHSQGTMGTLGDSTSKRIAAVIKSSAAAGGSLGHGPPVAGGAKYYGGYQGPMAGTWSKKPTGRGDPASPLRNMPSHANTAGRRPKVRPNSEGEKALWDTLPAKELPHAPAKGGRPASPRKQRPQSAAATMRERPGYGTASTPGVQRPDACHLRARCVQHCLPCHLVASCHAKRFLQCCRPRDTMTEACPVLQDVHSASQLRCVRRRPHRRPSHRCASSERWRASFHRPLRLPPAS